MFQVVLVSGGDPWVCSGYGKGVRSMRGAKKIAGESGSIIMYSQATQGTSLTLTTTKRISKQTKAVI